MHRGTVLAGKRACVRVLVNAPSKVRAAPRHVNGRDTLTGATRQPAQRTTISTTSTNTGQFAPTPVSAVLYR
ncbi:MAG: hypothetical protein ACPIOQ_22365 [Promethearchaeia archaeon]